MSDQTDRWVGENELFVSPDGNDRCSGRLPASHSRGNDGPLRTIGEAQRRVRALRDLGESVVPWNSVIATPRRQPMPLGRVNIPSSMVR